MTAQQLVQYIGWALFAAVFITTLVQAIRFPRRSTIDPALLFGVIVVISGNSLAVAVSSWRPPTLVSDFLGCLLLALPYLLLRLVEDFSLIPKALSWTAGGGLLLACAALFATNAPRPKWLNLLLVLYFVALMAFDTVAFIRETFLTGGVTRRRLMAVAAGSGCLALVLVIAALQIVFPGTVSADLILSDVCALGSGVAYYLGFATPGWLRRAWQEPELRAFLRRAASLPRLPDTSDIVQELELGAARSLGATSASIGLWDPDIERLRFAPRHFPSGLPQDLGKEDDTVPVDPRTILTGQAFLRQTAHLSTDPGRENPALRRVYAETGTRVLLAAPITAGEQRIGILAATARATIFAEEDLTLLRMLADQAAVILESRALIDQAARVRAREEVTRMRNDFLSAAAHDLKSPLTSIYGRAQLLQRRALRDGGKVDFDSIETIVRETARLRTLVNELLDADRVERQTLTSARDYVDIGGTIRAATERELAGEHSLDTEVSEGLFGRFDAVRIRQLLDNLVENAVKYSPNGGSIRIAARRQDGQVHIEVTDQGIGIGADELSHIFERFHRGSNVNDRRYPGMGLGLYICRGIVEEHQGQIWAESRLGAGTTIHVTLPLESDAADEQVSVVGRA